MIGYAAYCSCKIFIVFSSFSNKLLPKVQFQSFLLPERDGRKRLRTFKELLWLTEKGFIVTNYYLNVTQSFRDLFGSLQQCLLSLKKSWRNQWTRGSVLAEDRKLRRFQEGTLRVLIQNNSPQGPDSEHLKLLLFWYILWCEILRVKISSNLSVYAHIKFLKNREN